MQLRNSHFIVLLPVLFACSAPPAPQAAEKASGPTESVADVTKAIDDANHRFLDALAKNDAATASNNYADDAILMMPTKPAWSGHAAIADGLKSMLAEASLTNGKPHTTDVMVAGDLAVETGTFEWTVTPKKGAAMTDKGKYLTVWKKQADGSWKIIRDINNSDLPAGK